MKAPWTISPSMRELIKDVEAYAARVGVKPETVVKSAANVNLYSWARWKSGEASCSLEKHDMVRTYMIKYPNGKRRGRPTQEAA